jgi:hypothetical protein
MGDNDPFLILDQPCDTAIEGVIRQIGLTGLRVMRTFDSNIARHAEARCACPHHGTDQCDCQMVVLLVYGGNRHPVSIVAHGHNGRTFFSMVDTAQQRADPRLEAAIRLALFPRISQ